MKRMVNLLRGTGSLTVQGDFPERFLNLCAQEAIPCWGLSWRDGHTLEVQIHQDHRRRAEEIARRSGCTATLEGARGLPSFLGRFQRRYSFLIGLALALAAVCFLSRFVLTIQVVGNQKISTASILSVLHRQGVRPGVYGPSLDRKVIAQQALLELEDLSWMSINRYGTRLEVVVREAVKPPELLEEEGYYHVVAKTDGLITQVEATQGEAVVQKGDVVAQGDCLISGLVTMEPPLYSDLPTRFYQTHARGQVYARTWRRLEGVLPLRLQVKEYTGREETKMSLTVLNHTIDFFKNSSISPPNYDKITEVHQLTLPEGRGLPLMLTIQHLREYQLVEVPVNLEAGQKMMEEELLHQLQGLMGTEGQILDVRYEAQAQDGLLKVTLYAECREEIGEILPGPNTTLGDDPMEQESEHP